MVKALNKADVPLRVIKRFRKEVAAVANLRVGAAGQLLCKRATGFWGEQEDVLSPYHVMTHLFLDNLQLGGVDEVPTLLLLGEEQEPVWTLMARVWLERMPMDLKEEFKVWCCNT